MGIKSPFFSVVIPTYNRVHKILECVKSVLDQTFRDYEIVIIDNGSTDGTEEIIKNNIIDKRLRYFWQIGSGSPANSRNQGIINSKGEWVSFLDSDDIWHPEKLKCCYEHIQNNPSVDVICHHERLVSPRSNSKEKILRHGRKTKDMYKSLLMEGNCFSPSATSIKRQFLINNNLFFKESDHFAIVEDYDLWLRIAKKGAQFFSFNKCLGDYIVDDENLIGDWERYISNIENLLRYHAYHLQDFEPDHEKLFSKLQTRLHFDKLKRAFKEKDFKCAAFELNSILRKYPAFLPKKIFQKAISTVG